MKKINLTDIDFGAIIYCTSSFLWYQHIYQYFYEYTLADSFGLALSAAIPFRAKEVSMTTYPVPMQGM